MSDLVQLIGAILTLIGSLGGAYLVVRRGRKSDTETNTLATKKEDREDRDSLIQTYRDELKERDTRLDKIEAAVKKITREFRISINYIEAGLLWERRGSNPPKPTIPIELHEYLDPALIREHQRQEEQHTPKA
ncbi:hypothetical protein PTW37_06460 [Arthrobacter agilis]|uniref:hypothetical protein n=1 Tax=Arthrobacter agilis TaxID=37921 RepID=UPI00236562A7|nr:hypothetical protein [Arthrobacter agilis]WDF34536.1 hypothetical protein PTW37_06460 [Arthrobacter agilis]